MAEATSDESCAVVDVPPDPLVLPVLSCAEDVAAGVERKEAISCTELFAGLLLFNAVT